MGLPRSLAMLFLLMWLFCLPSRRAQSPGSSTRPERVLDALLQDYAFRAFVRPKTGIPYTGTVPANISGIKISAMRLRSGSLRSKGVEMYKEFRIPKGVIVHPYVERLVLVYQNLGNWSTVYYRDRLPGYTYLAPVLGLLAYDASNLNATNLDEWNITASNESISIEFQDVNSVPSAAKCVWFDLQGYYNFSNVLSGNVCTTIQQGHFSIVVESTAPSPAPVPPPNVVPGPSGGGKKNNSKVWIIVGSVLGGLVLLVLLGCLVLWVLGYKRRKKMQHMENAAEVGESLRMTLVGNTKAPAAMVTRTQPLLENEYVP